MKYEPNAAKIFYFANRSIAVMWAGDSTLQAEILQVLSDRIAATEGDTALVSDVARAYFCAYQEAFAFRAEARILKRYGITFADFNAGRHKLTPQVEKVLQQRLVDFEVSWPPEIAAIVTGMDSQGSHIWTIDNYDLKCFDIEGFAAIGTGGADAVAFLRAVKFSQRESPNNTMLLAYAAKKRGEGPPTVGTATDMFMILDPSTGSRIEDEVLKRLDAAYRVIVDGELSALRDGFDTFAAGMKPLVTEWMDPMAPDGHE